MGLPNRWKEAIRILAVIKREEVMGDSKYTKKLSFLTGLCLNMLSSGKKSDRGVMARLRLLLKYGDIRSTQSDVTL